MEPQDWKVVSPPLREAIECDCEQCGWHGKARDLIVTQRQNNERPSQLSCPKCNNPIVGIGCR